MHPATSRNKPPGWRGAVSGILVVMAATAGLALAGLALAALAALLA